MDSKTVVGIAGALGVGIGLGTWFTHRPPPPGREAQDLAAEVARLRTAADEQAARLARLERAALPPGEGGLLPAATQEQAGGPARRESPDARLDRLEKAVAALEARGAPAASPPAEPPAARGKRILAELLSIEDPTRQVALQNAVGDLVRIGDPVVPDILAELDSGLEKRYHPEGSGMAMSAGKVTFSSLRMTLIDALRQIGTPAARKGLFASVAKSHRLTDYRDLLLPWSMSADPAVVEGIAALVPDMLRAVAEKGILREDYDAQQLVRHLVGWIHLHPVPDIEGPLEEALLRIPADRDGLGGGYEVLFGLLVRVSPERAVRTVLAVEEKSPGALPWLCRGIQDPVPLAAAARFYEALLAAGSLEAEARRGLYWTLPTRPSDTIRDPAKRAEDALALAAFLEARIAVENESGPRGAAEAKLKELRDWIARVRK